MLLLSCLEGLATTKFLKPKALWSNALQAQWLQAK